MSAGPDNEITTDNPSSDEVSCEISAATANDPSSEETSPSVSGAMGYEIPSDVSAPVDDSPSSDEITSQPSGATSCLVPPEVMNLLKQNLDEYQVSEELKNASTNNPAAVNAPPEVKAAFSRLGRTDVPPDVSEVVDDNGKTASQKSLENIFSPRDKGKPSKDVTIAANAQIAPEPVCCLRRLWLQIDPWIAYHKKYRFFILIAHFVGIIGLFFLGLRFTPLPDPYPTRFAVTGAIILTLRCISMHVIIPEGPPYKATLTGNPLYEAKRLSKRTSKNN